jgi:hypothetical protein
MVVAMQALHWDQPFIQYGIGAFETLRCIKGEFPLQTYHRRRLLKALEAWDVPPEKLDASWAELLHRGRSCTGEGRFKLLVGLDQHGGLVSHIYQFDYTAITAPRRLCLGPQVILAPQYFKSSSYEAHYWAKQHAAKLGFDDVLYVDAQHQPLECSTSAILEYRDDVFWAPSGPLLASVSVNSLVERFPNHFKRSPKLVGGNWPQRQWVTCNALHGLMAVESIWEGTLFHNHRSSSGSCEFLDSASQACPLVPSEVLRYWNQQLFSIPAP